MGTETGKACSEDATYEHDTENQPRPLLPSPPQAGRGLKMAETLRLGPPAAQWGTQDLEGPPRCWCQSGAEPGPVRRHPRPGPGLPLPETRLPSLPHMLGWKHRAGDAGLPSTDPELGPVCCPAASSPPPLSPSVHGPSPRSPTLWGHPRGEPRSSGAERPCPGPGLGHRSPPHVRSDSPVTSDEVHQLAGGDGHG